MQHQPSMEAHRVAGEVAVRARRRLHHEGDVIPEAGREQLQQGWSGGQRRNQSFAGRQASSDSGSR
jgi:hypothetical protein